MDEHFDEHEFDKPRRSAFTGAVFGHAIGDALGAPVEFMTREAILLTYPPDGVDGFEPFHYGGVTLPRGSYTDDTQMMLATAVGILRALQRERRFGMADPAEVVFERYREWYATQDIPSQRRAPGATCLEACANGVPGSTFEPLNDRKGSGGIMRVTPVGLAYPPGSAFETGAELAALTHGHPSGYLAAGFFSEVLSRAVRGTTLADAIAATRETLVGWDDHDEVLESVDLAVELFIGDADLDSSYERLGEGWVAEEALGIALFSALNFPDDFAEGTLAAVNITGDSDTTGGLTGALLGATLGFDSIPGDWSREIEDRQLLDAVANDLFDAFVEDLPLDQLVYPPE